MKHHYCDLATKLYDHDVPDLAQIPYDTRYLRLTARYLHDISSINNLVHLRVLDISYTYVTRLPMLPNLRQLQMIATNINETDLAALPRLSHIKSDDDDWCRFSIMSHLRVLHCAIVRHPETLHLRFPQLTTLRFQRVIPSARSRDVPKATPSYYHDLDYYLAHTTRSVISDPDAAQIWDFDDTCIQIDMDVQQWYHGDYEVATNCHLPVINAYPVPTVTIHVDDIMDTIWYGGWLSSVTRY